MTVNVVAYSVPLFSCTPRKELNEANSVGHVIISGEKAY